MHICCRNGHFFFFLAQTRASREPGACEQSDIETLQSPMAQKHHSARHQAGTRAFAAASQRVCACDTPAPGRLAPCVLAHTPQRAAGHSAPLAPGCSNGVAHLGGCWHLERRQRAARLACQGEASRKPGCWTVNAGALTSRPSQAGPSQAFYFCRLGSAWAEPSLLHLVAGGAQQPAAAASTTAAGGATAHVPLL